ncbi:MAG: FadR/GntR family transcriptional regulator, partial [Ferrimicrobium sp.]
ASLGLLVGSHRPGTEDLLEARMVLERPASRLAAIRHDAALLSRIKSTVPSGPVPNEDMYQSHFHIAVLEASGNVMLEVMTRPVFDVLRTRMVRSAAPPDFWDRVVEDHRKILDAITRRDGDEAESAMQEHLMHISSVYSSIDSVRHPDLIGQASGVVPVSQDNSDGDR